MDDHFAPRGAPAAVTVCRHLTAFSELPETRSAPASSASDDGRRRLATSVAGAVLVVAGAVGLHHLRHSGHGSGEWVVWVAVLLCWLTALGGGITLATWGARPITAIAFEAGKAKASEPARAGLWWTLSGRQPSAQASNAAGSAAHQNPRPNLRPDPTGQVASGVSLASGPVNTATSLGASDMPDTSCASDLLSEGGSAQALSGGSGLRGHLAQAPMETE